MGKRKRGFPRENIAARIEIVKQILRPCVERENKLQRKKYKEIKKEKEIKKMLGERN